MHAARFVNRPEASFTALGVAGTLAAAAFHSGSPGSMDSTDRIAYDSTTGGLFYDTDGGGGATAIKIAQLSTGLTLTNADILVI